MQLIGFTGPDGVTHVARLFDDGGLADLGPREAFWAAPRAGVAAAPDTPTGGLTRAGVTECPVVPAEARVLCIGLNYSDHAKEAGFEVPEHPTVFARWTASLATEGAVVRAPAGELGLDWEVELAVVLGDTVADAEPAGALDAVLGYAAFNDVSARRAQLLTPQWTLGKNVDASGPMSPLRTADEVGDPAAGLRLTTTVDGVVRQDGTTADMIFDVPTLVSFLSRYLTLHPGDVIATGTPAGIGNAMRPRVLMQPGESVTVEVERVGTVTVTVGEPR